MNLSASWVRDDGRTPSGTAAGQINRLRHTLIIGSLVFIGYYGAAALGFALTFQPTPVSVLWPPNAVLLTALLLTPTRAWGLIFLAAFPAHLAAQVQSNVPPAMILCWFISNSCEALIGAGCIRHFIARPVRLDCLRNVATFCFFAAFLGPFLSSFLDAGFVIWNKWGAGSYAKIWRTRFTSSVLAALTVAPFVLTWAHHGLARLKEAPRRRWWEASALFLGLLALSFVGLYHFGPGTEPALLFLPLPALLYAAVRFGTCGSITAVCAVAFLTVWSAAHGHGPFTAASPEERALSVQVFLIVISITLMLLAAVIEERDCADESLREREILNHGVIDSLTSLLAILDHTGRIIAVNESWHKAYEGGEGVAAKVSVGVDYLEVCRHAVQVGDRSVDKVLAGIEGVLSGAEKNFICEYECATPAGMRWFEMLVLPLRTKRGGAVVKHRDITRHRLAENALRERDERINLAAESANLTLWTIDYERNESWMSDKGRELFGFAPDERLSREVFLSRVHPEDRQNVDAAIDRARAAAETFEIEYRLVRPDGKIHWIISRGRYVKNDRGEMSELLGVAIDVTGRKQSEQLFQLAADASHLGVWDWDETTGELLWDGATREIFDVPADVQMTLDIFYGRVHPHDLESVRQNWRRALESGLPVQVQYRVQRRDGTIRWVDSRGRGHYDDKGKPRGMTGIVIDVTAQMNANLELRLQREEMARLNRVASMGELTASLAHELNQPLTAIASNAAAGRRFLASGSADPKMFEELLADVFADARRAGEVIHGIHRFMRKGDGTRHIVNLNQVIHEVLRLLHSDLLGRAVTVETALAPHLASIQADPVHMQQALLNLIMNALEAMQETTAAQRHISISTSSTTGSVSVSVRDHGTGLPKDEPDKIFAHFFSTKPNGMGMGLTIVRSIIEAHGGELGAENLPDGARFFFSLPAA